MGMPFLHSNSCSNVEFGVEVLFRGEFVEVQLCDVVGDACAHLQFAHERLDALDKDRREEVRQLLAYLDKALFPVKRAFRLEVLVYFLYQFVFFLVCVRALRRF